MIEARGLTKRYGDKVAVDDLSFTVQPGIVTGLPRTQRRRQVDDDADDPRPRPADRRARRSVNGRRYGDRRRRRCARSARCSTPRDVHGGRTARAHLRALAQTNGLAGSAGRRGARADRHDRRWPASAIKGFSLGMSPAARHRRRAARRPGRADVRRAGQRPRPRGHPLDPQLHAVPRRRRAARSSSRAT